MPEEQMKGLGNDSPQDSHLYRDGRDAPGTVPAGLGNRNGHDFAGDAELVHESYGVLPSWRASILAASAPIPSPFSAEVSKTSMAGLTARAAVFTSSTQNLT